MPAQGLGGGGGAWSVLSSWKSLGALRARPAPMRLILAFLWLEQLGVLCPDYAQ